MIAEEQLIWRGNTPPVYRMHVLCKPTITMEMPTTHIAGLADQLKCDFELHHLETDEKIRMVKIHSQKFSHLGYTKSAMRFYLIERNTPQLICHERVPERIFNQMRRADSAYRFYKKHASRSYPIKQLDT